MTDQRAAPASSLPPPPPPPPPRPAAPPATAHPTTAWGPSRSTSPSLGVPATASVIGRIGLLVGGYFALGAVWAISRALHDAVGPPEVGLLVSGGTALGLVLFARHVHGSELDALGVMAALGSTGFVVATTAELGGVLGFEGRALFWLVLLVCLPTAVATLLWYPHPLLGVNVAIGAAALVIAAPIGGDRVASGKALLLGLVLAGLAAAVDLRTRSRAGSVLHYAAIATLGVADVIVVVQLPVVVDGLVLATLAVGHLGVALLLRRRTWAVSGWITAAIAVLQVTGAAVGPALLGSVTAVLAAAPLVWAAITVQREGERVRALLLERLPPEVAVTFPP